MTGVRAAVHGLLVTLDSRYCGPQRPQTFNVIMFFLVIVFMTVWCLSTDCTGNTGQQNAVSGWVKAV